MITHALPKSSALENALRDFNVAFDMDLRLPIWPRDLESAALIAELRGRQDIAGKLRVFLPASSEVSNRRDAAVNSENGHQLGAGAKTPEEVAA